jgi:hypothetical protein
MTEAIVNQSAKEPKRRKRKPASAHQIAVNRANAAKSTGPTSPEGKARSSQNSIKHGLCASRFTVVRLEDPAELEELRANLVHCYRPVNSQELEAIDCMARAQLSMRRAAQLEASLFTSALSESLVDPQIRMEPELQQNVQVTKEQNRGFFLAEGVRKLARESNSLSLMLRYQAHAERQYRRAVEEFERLKKLRPEMPNEPISEHPFPSETTQSEPVTPPPEPQSPSGPRPAGVRNGRPSGGAGEALCAFACQSQSLSEAATVRERSAGTA